MLMGGGSSVFDKISPDDLIVAFYPCTYFSTLSLMDMLMKAVNWRKHSDLDKIKGILERAKRREEFYERLMKFVYVCLSRNLKMVFENPYTKPCYLDNDFLKAPDIIDSNRMDRGDYFRKPTAYWFWNFEPCRDCFTKQKDKENKKVLDHTGINRSLISPDYARNWIKDFILGTGTKINQKEEKGFSFGKF